MSNKDNARRAHMKVFFAGVDITDSISEYLISLAYTDNEEDETDDLQITLADRDSIWLTKWLNVAIDALRENPPIEKTDSKLTNDSESAVTSYIVTSAGGVTVRSRAGEQYGVYGTLAYGTVVSVHSVSNGWAKITYSGLPAYVASSSLTATVSKEETATYAEESQSSSQSWVVGESVIATGRPQYASDGSGNPGATVTNYSGTVTYLNLGEGIPYPIHVGSLGWFSEGQVQKSGETVRTSSSTDKASKGLKIQAVIASENIDGEGSDAILECGQFELDNISVSGPPDTITIKGTSLPYSSTVRQMHKSRSWESYTLSGIGNEIAYTNGMAFMFLSGSDPIYARIEQYKQSDIAFLQKLCRDAGFSLKVSNNIIVIFDQAEYEAKKSVKTIKRGKLGGYSKYKLSTSENGKYTSCRVSYTDSSGNVISGTAYVEDYKEDAEDNQCLEVYQKVSSTAEAETLADKMLRFHNKYEFTASFTFPGDPSLVAGNKVTLEGFGAWDGGYIIKQAKHSVGSSGYTTQVSLRHTLYGA